MANEEQLAILESGVEAWDAWRKQRLAAHIDLSGANLLDTNLRGANLRDADLRGANLRGANMRGANMSQASLVNADLIEATLDEADLTNADLNHATLIGSNLSRAKLRDADLHGANLRRANLRAADLRRANLREAALPRADLRGARLTATFLNRADLTETNLSGAFLNGANLSEANLTRTDLRGTDLRRANLSLGRLVGTLVHKATLTDCRIYGISAWDLQLDSATQQKDLIITPEGQATITVDNLEMAQFIYLLLNNQRIRHVIDTITSKVVLILGRFTEERKAVLTALRDELRRRDYLPVLFDFDKPASRDLTETIQTLAGMARFVIADLTDAKSLPQELSVIVPNLPSVPVQPLLLVGASGYAMFEHFERYPWVLPKQRYERTEDLLAGLANQVITPAEAKAAELQGHKPPPT